MKYKRQVFLRPNQNLHHPKGGWFTTGTFGTMEDAQHIGDVSNDVLDRANKPRSITRIIEVK